MTINDTNNIAIDQLNEDELATLNERIVARLKYLDSLHTHREMMRFQVGENVCFNPPGKAQQCGVLVKHNKKTVTIIAEGGRRWNVSPHLLYRVTEAHNRSANAAWQHSAANGITNNVIALNLRK